MYQFLNLFVYKNVWRKVCHLLKIRCIVVKNNINIIEYKELIIIKQKEMLCNCKKYKKYKPIVDENDKSLNSTQKEELKKNINYEWFIETTISNILIENPHPNIVTIYKVEKDFIEMEWLNTQFISKNVDIIALYEAKKHMQKLGISYIDWKYDNIGFTDLHKIKIFDFNFSGIFDTSNNDIWIYKPSDGYKYKICVNNDYITPLNMDNYAFLHGFYIEPYE